MLRPIYTRYRLVGGLLELCRWRWITRASPASGRVRFDEWPGLEWEIVADYQRDAHGPGDLPACPPSMRDGRLRTSPEMVTRLRHAYDRGLSQSAAARYAGCKRDTARRHFARMGMQ